MVFEQEDSTISSATLRLAREGNNKAWEAIWSYYSDRVFRQCRRLGMSPREAEDVTVDVFRKVWMKLGSFSREESNQSLGAWIQRITETTALDQHRLRKQKQTLVGDAAFTPLTIDCDQEIRGEARDLSPIWVALWRALAIVENNCSQRTWECFRMARFLHTPHQEISAQLGMTLTNVSTTVRRVFERIRDESILQLQLSGFAVDETGKITANSVQVTTGKKSRDVESLKDQGRKSLAKP